MDCEPVRSEQTATQATSGPFSYQASQRSIAAYFATGKSFGFPASFFIHPETAEAHPQTFLALREQGADLGLHIHPYKIRGTRHHNHFGSLSEWDQAILIAESAQRWQLALGMPPEYFRPGTFSANDATFRVLHKLGFRGGSLSCPGRMYPDLYAVWSGCPPDPHYAHPNFRLLEGDLDFVNLPLTVDFSRLETVNGRSFYRDLRPDYLQADYDAVAENIVGQLQARNPTVPMIMVVTHNDHAFEDPQSRGSKNLQSGLTAIQKACEKAGVTPIGATLSEVCREYRNRAKRTAPEFVLGHASIQAGQ